MAKKQTLNIDGTEIVLVQQNEQVSPIGSETVIPLSPLAFGKVSIILILIMANLPQLKVRQG